MDTNLAIVIEIPLQITVVKTPNTLVTMLNIPNISVVKILERIILYKKPNALVDTLNIVIINNDFTNDFIISPQSYNFILLYWKNI